LLPHVPPQEFGVPVGFVVEVAVADADEVDVDVGVGEELDVDVLVGVGDELTNENDSVQELGGSVGRTS